MLFIFSTPVLIRHLWQLKKVVLLHCCFIRAVLLLNLASDEHSSLFLTINWEKEFCKYCLQDVWCRDLNSTRF